MSKDFTLPKCSTSFSVSLPQYMVEILDAYVDRQDEMNRSQVILAALKLYFEQVTMAEIRGLDLMKRIYLRITGKSCQIL